MTDHQRRQRQIFSQFQIHCSFIQTCLISLLLTGGSILVKQSFSASYHYNRHHLKHQQLKMSLNCVLGCEVLSHHIRIVVPYGTRLGLKGIRQGDLLIDADQF